MNFVEINTKYTMVERERETHTLLPSLEEPDLWLEKVAGQGSAIQSDKCWLCAVIATVQLMLPSFDLHPIYLFISIAKTKQGLLYGSLWPLVCWKYNKVWNNRGRECPQCISYKWKCCHISGLLLSNEKYEWENRKSKVKHRCAWQN